MRRGRACPLPSSARGDGGAERRLRPPPPDPLASGLRHLCHLTEDKLRADRPRRREGPFPDLHLQGQVYLIEVERREAPADLPSDPSTARAARPAS